MTTLEWFHYMTCFSYGHEWLIENAFGKCPHPECMAPEDPMKPVYYRVLKVDSYLFAVCEVHKVRWCVGYYADDSGRNCETAQALLAYRDVTDEVAETKQVEMVSAVI